MVELRVYLLPECVINPLPATRAVAEAATAFGALVLKKVVEKGISGISQKLKKAGGSQTRQLSGTTFVDMYTTDDAQALSPNPDLCCLLAVWFGGPDDADSEEEADHDDVAHDLQDNGVIPADARLYGVLEAVIRPTADRTAFYLDTRHFSVRRFFGGRSDESRAYVVTVGMSTPDDTVGGATFALGNISFGTRAVGDSVVSPGRPAEEHPHYRSNLMPWSVISPPSKAAYDADVATGNAANRSYMPVTVSVTVSETADGNSLLLALGELLGSVSEDVAGEVTRRVLPGEIRQAALEESANATQLYENELEAEIAVLKAEREYKAGKDDEKPGLLLALEISRRKRALQTRRREAAGLPRPEGLS